MIIINFESYINMITLMNIAMNLNNFFQMKRKNVTGSIRLNINN